MRIERRPEHRRHPAAGPDVVADAQVLLLVEARKEPAGHDQQDREDRQGDPDRTQREAAFGHGQFHTTQA